LGIAEMIEGGQECRAGLRLRPNEWIAGWEHNGGDVSDIN